ncbi:hypothetical protein VULLAG_LOCUS15318 [Vulpes lagopus]
MGLQCPGAVCGLRVGERTERKEAQAFYWSGTGGKRSWVLRMGRRSRWSCAPGGLVRTPLRDLRSRAPSSGDFSWTFLPRGCSVAQRVRPGWCTASRKRRHPRGGVAGRAGPAPAPAPAPAL